jgi:double-stranded uracil-DNA glycosylase
MLPDLLAPDLKLIICGSAVGGRSAVLGHYYAGPGNKFWHTLVATGLTPRTLHPSEACRLLDFGIGLTDLVKNQVGSDRDIQFERDEREHLHMKILDYQPYYLCFNGKRAAKEFFGSEQVAFGLQEKKIGVTTNLFVAPSTSAAANGSWDLSVWQELADLVLGYAEFRISSRR